MRQPGGAGLVLTEKARSKGGRQSVTHTGPRVSLNPASGSRADTKGRQLVRGRCAQAAHAREGGGSGGAAVSGSASSRPTCIALTGPQEAADVCDDEVGAVAGQHAKAQRLQAPRQQLALALQGGAHA